jgi:bacterioferritin-associated ferredoxin
VVCRCEEVTAGTLRATATRWGTLELNRLKALCRVGMGRCQGRMCGAAAAEILAAHRGVPVEAVGRLRGQAPVKPIPVAIEDAPEAAA